MSTNAYQKITDAILAAMENGGAWQRPWVGRLEMPSNGVTGRRYRGSNVIALWVTSQLAGYSESRWATLKQWSAAGKRVKRGEHGTPIIFFKMLDRASSDSDDLDRIPLARISYAFNVEQTEGYEPPQDVPVRVAHIDEADVLISATGATIKHGGIQACYRPLDDIIMMPTLASFVGTATSTPTEAYYGVLLHELTHWTGPRLQRTFGKHFGDETYAAEELVAELGSAFLCAELGIAAEPRADHAAYLASWIKMLRADPKAFPMAASKAAQAVDFLLAFRSQDETREAA